MSVFVGRVEPLARLTAAYQASTTGSGVVPGWAGLMLVTGEAGIGKTALLARFSNEVLLAGGTVVWGTCWDGDQTPAWWPWTQALRALVEQSGEAAGPELAAIIPELAGSAEPALAPAGGVGRVQVFDAAGRLLRRAAGRGPVVVILDDLQWADEATVDLLRFVAQSPQGGALLLIGAYRPHELPPGVNAVLAELATTAELVPLQGLSADEVAELAQTVAGPAVPLEWGRIVHERSGGIRSTPGSCAPSWPLRGRLMTSPWPSAMSSAADSPACPRSALPCWMPPQ